MIKFRSTEDRDFKKVYNFQNATQTLIMFANEPLIAKPETKFYYSNFGWQLIGAIVESVTNQRYETLINDVSQTWNEKYTNGKTFCNNR